MKRREFAGLSLLAIGSIFGSIAAMASGKKGHKVSSDLESGLASKSNAAGTGTATAGSTSSTTTSRSSKDAQNTRVSAETFFITITTFFPYPMAAQEYKALLQGCRNQEESDELLNIMTAEGKFLSYGSKLAEDKVTTCFEFRDKAAFEEYERRFVQIPGNSTAKKKALGFRSQREFVKTVFA